jgi:hypothetical protein
MHIKTAFPVVAVFLFLGKYFAKLDIKWQLTAPTQHNRSAWLKVKCVPARFWGEAVRTAVYFLNCRTMKFVGGKTPYKAWCTSKPRAVVRPRKHGCVSPPQETSLGLSTTSSLMKTRLATGITLCVQEWATARWKQFSVKHFVLHVEG